MGRDKRRPALALSPDHRNERANDVIVIPCSTRLRPAPTHVLLRSGQGGLAESTVLKCEQIPTLAKGGYPRAGARSRRRRLESATDESGPAPVARRGPKRARAPRCAAPSPEGGVFLRNAYCLSNTAAMLNRLPFASRPLSLTVQRLPSGATTTRPVRPTLPPFLPLNSSVRSSIFR